MSINLDNINREVTRTKNKALNIVKKVFASIFGGIAITLLCIGIASLNINIPLVIICIFFYIPAGLFAFFSALLISKTIHGSVYSKLLNDCQDTLAKIKSLIMSSKMRNELGYLPKTLKDDVEDVKHIIKNLNDIDKILDRPEWNEVFINNKIRSEQQKTVPDAVLMQGFREQKNHIAQMQESKVKLLSQIAKIQQNFNSIYVKLTLVDTHDKVKMDEIETDIQKILDRKIKAASFEEQLDKEYDAR